MGRTHLRSDSRGMTLVEVMVVLLIVALLTSAVVVGTGQTANARLKRTASMVSGAVRIAMTRASVTSKSQRIVFDFEKNELSLEEATQPMLVTKDSKLASGGAAAATEAERAAVAEGERIVKGPQAPKPRFSPVTGLGAQDRAGTRGPRPLERGITFRSVETGHDTAARTEGRAYLYFFPGGQTERASIQLRIGTSEEDDRTMTLLIAPLTGKVTSKFGAVAMPRPLDEKEASDREDPGGGF